MKRSRLKRNSGMRRKRMLTMADVMRINQEKGQHWFEPDTMRFFKSQIESPLIANKYFITSEKAPHDVRKFSVREFNPKTGSVNTVGEFYSYSTKAQARKKIKELTGE